VGSGARKRKVKEKKRKKKEEIKNKRFEIKHRKKIVKVISIILYSPFIFYSCGQIVSQVGKWIDREIGFLNLLIIQVVMVFIVSLAGWFVKIIYLDTDKK